MTILTHECIWNLNGRYITAKKDNIFYYGKVVETYYIRGFSHNYVIFVDEQKIVISSDDIISVCSIDFS